jgi:aldehyde dehydrogenase (NAD+)
VVQRSIAEELVDRLVERAGRIKIGDPRDPATQMGPMATAAQLERVAGYVDAAIARGATVLTGGRRAQVAGFDHGNFYEPTIVGGIEPSDPIAQEEVFGPVLAVLPFEDEADAVRIANSTEYALASGVWTANVKRAHRVARALRAGTIWVNMYRGATPLMPQGGSGLSGYGRENGVEAIREFVHTKGVWIETSDETHDPFQVRL